MEKLEREAAKAWIVKTCGEGWLNMADIAYDNLPEGLFITEVFQKWGGLKINFEGENEVFEELTDQIYYLSQYLCELCGKSAQTAILDGWETAVCREHFEKSAAKEKFCTPYNQV
jgi:hypothetical protein